MARYWGLIGYSETIETSPGVWEETNIIERQYKGDVIRNSRIIDSRNKVNDDINLSLQISIVADRYALNNFNTLKYATYNHSKWKITNVEMQSPRIILTLGGVYND